jgi:hypothetical protein
MKKRIISTLFILLIAGLSVCSILSAQDSYEIIGYGLTFKDIEPDFSRAKNYYTFTEQEMTKGVLVNDEYALIAPVIPKHSELKNTVGLMWWPYQSRLPVFIYKTKYNQIAIDKEIKISWNDVKAKAVTYNGSTVISGWKFKNEDILLGLTKYLVLNSHYAASAYVFSNTGVVSASVDLDFIDNVACAQSNDTICNHFKDFLPDYTIAK